ncbi:putative membrne protein [Candidatus Phytoplasma solani]|uniref:hypothetical protein n=1 Tax=Candidatus Phytoplasma solani TaxID=69896 RepID=UPI0032D9F8C7
MGQQQKKKLIIGAIISTICVVLLVVLLVFMLGKTELSEVLKPNKDKIELTQVEKGEPEVESVLNKVKKADTQVELKDVTIAIVDNKLKVAVKANSKNLKGDPVSFDFEVKTEQSSTQKELSEVLKPNKDKIELTQVEKGEPEVESVLNKVKKADTQVELKDVTIAIVDNKLKVAVKANSKNLKGDPVSFNFEVKTEQSSTQKELSEVLKPNKDKIELTQVEKGEPEVESVLNKVKKADTQVELKDVTIAIVDNKLKVAVKANSKNLKGDPVSFNFEVEDLL